MLPPTGTTVRRQMRQRARFTRRAIGYASSSGRGLRQNGQHSQPAITSAPQGQRHDRLLGDHILTQNDLLGKTPDFPDAVAIGGWGMDDHPPGGFDQPELKPNTFVTPPFLGAFAWTLLAGPNAGALNKLYRALTGSEEALFNIFTMAGLIFVMALYSFPYVFSMIANVFELISSDLEDAAEILGANKWRTAWTVTLPLALPALIGGFIVAFLHSLSLFGAPAILGLPAGLHTITTQIWALFQYPPRLDMAAAFAVPLLLATMTLIAVQKKILGRKGYSTVGGKGGQKRLIRLGWGRIPALIFVLSILSLSVFLPYWILLKAALSKAWALPLTWDNFTLHNLSFTFFEYGDTQRAIYNTFKLGLITATAGTLLATLIAYITNRNLFRGARYLSFFALAPLAGVYYPISILPFWVQVLSAAIPASYVFEGMRAVLIDHTVRLDLMLSGAALNIVWLAVGIGGFLIFHRQARERGMLLQVGE